jgi:SulP family sulfate permease
MALVSSAVLAAVTPLLSSTRGVVSITQGVPVVALASVLGPIVARLTGEPQTARFATLVAATMLTTLFIGATSLALGTFRLGRFIRFAPFPVIGGFLAGSGWLILHGGLDLIAGRGTLQDPLGVLAEPSLLPKVGLAAVFIAVVVALGKATRLRLAMPATVVGALVLFNVVVRAAGVSPDTLRDAGWLLHLPDKTTLWPPLMPADFGLIDWRAILAGAVSAPSVAVLTVLALLMNATGIELQERRDGDLDRELRAVGYANLIAGAAGGLPGYHTVSLTLLATRLGARGIAVGLTVAAVCLIALAFGGPVLALMPTPLLGAMLVWIGAGLIGEWLLGSYARLPRREYLVVALIFCVIVIAGFAWGLLVGLAGAIVLFVVEYGRIDIVRYIMTGRDYQTANDASEDRLEVLRRHGDAILIVRLQGYLFFGTADRLRKRMQQRIADHDGSRVRYLVTDFGRVTGLDSSTVLSFIRLGQTAEADGFTLVLTGMSQAIAAAMRRGGLANGAATAVHLEPTFDRGLEWCEDRLLSIVRAAQPPTAAAVIDRLTAMVGDRAAAEILLAAFTRMEVPDGAVLIEQGTPSNDIFFIEAGRAGVEIDADAGGNGANGTVGHGEAGGRIRLATLSQGSIVGEIAFYLGAPRLASVVAEGAMVVWRLSRGAMEELRATHSDVAAKFHEAMAAMLAGRLANTNKLVRLLAD